jgi:hypothetical protein
MGARGKKMYSFLLTNYSIKNSIVVLIFLLRSLLVRSSFRKCYYTTVLLGSLGYLWVVSSFCIDPVLFCAIIPIKIYSNISDDKAQILSENKTKSGIYMWKNLVNDKQYIGSSDNLKRRFS